MSLRILLDETSPPHPVTRYREAKAMSQRELAELVGVSQQTVSAMERGTFGQGWQTGAKVRVASVLGVKVRDIFPYPDEA